MATRTALESSKFDLMSDIANLKLKFAALDRDKLETEHKLRMAQVSIYWNVVLASTRLFAGRDNASAEESPTRLVQLLTQCTATTTTVLRQSTAWCE